jgi:hypothetical protein
MRCRGLCEAATTTSGGKEQKLALESRLIESIQAARERIVGRADSHDTAIAGTCQSAHSAIKLLAG